MKSKKIKDSILKSYFTALGISVLTLLACAFVMAIIIYSGDDPTGGVGVASLAALLCSAAVSGVIISRFKGDGGTKIAALASLTLVFVMLIICMILGGGKALPSALMNYGCYVGASLFAAYLGRKRGGKRRKRRG